MRWVVTDHNQSTTSGVMVLLKYNGVSFNVPQILCKMMKLLDFDIDYIN